MFIFATLHDFNLTDKIRTWKSESEPKTAKYKYTHVSLFKSADGSGKEGRFEHGGWMTLSFSPNEKGNAQGAECHVKQNAKKHPSIPLEGRLKQLREKRRKLSFRNRFYLLAWKPT